MIGIIVSGNCWFEYIFHLQIHFEYFNNKLVVSNKNCIKGHYRNLKIPKLYLVYF